MMEGIIDWLVRCLWDPTNSFIIVSQCCYIIMGKLIWLRIVFNSVKGPKNCLDASTTNGFVSFYFNQWKSYVLTSKSLTRLTDDPFGLRSTILLAGMHFCFQYGNLEPFESTFFYHRVQVIKYINKWISTGSPKPDPRIIRQMVTLSFTEVWCSPAVCDLDSH